MTRGPKAEESERGEPDPTATPPPLGPWPLALGPSSIGPFPARLERCDLGGEVVELYVVDDLERWVDRAALLRDDDIPEPPYWAHLWVGSRALARHILASERRFARAVDIGCGVGLAGLVAARRGARTTFLDYAPEALAFVRASAAHLGLSVDLLQADLRRPGLRGTFDLCLAADATYDPVLQQALADFLADHLAPQGVAWCAESVRTVDRRFQEACREHGLRCQETQLLEADEGRQVVVRLTEITRPA